MRRIILAVTVLFGVFLSGCANFTGMAFREPSEKLTATSNPIYLMTATIKNDYRANWQPKINIVHVDKEGAKESADRLNFTVDAAARNESGLSSLGNSYLFRMELPPGRYEIRGMSSTAAGFPIIGQFFTPMLSPLESKEPGVYYLGHVRATVRERTEKDFKAGPTIPLIDQAVVGASGGTFDVEITDQFAIDEAAFRAKFPALADVKIKKAILPAFDRAKAYKWWDAN